MGQSVRETTDDVGSWFCCCLLAPRDTGRVARTSGGYYMKKPVTSPEKRQGAGGVDTVASFSFLSSPSSLQQLASPRQRAASGPTAGWRAGGRSDQKIDGVAQGQRPRSVQDACPDIPGFSLYDSVMLPPRSLLQRCPCLPFSFLLAAFLS